MQVMALLLFSLVGMVVVVALSLTLYAALPRYFLECAQLHGRFHALQADEAAPNGTPDELLPEGSLVAIGAGR